MRAVGTAFAVQIGRDSTVVIVTDGRVSVDPSTAPTLTAASVAPLAFVDASHSIDISAGGTGRHPTITPLTPEVMAERLASRQRRVESSATPLVEVIAVVNRHNRFQFSIDDASLGRTPLSGVFRLDQPEELARLLESGFGLEVERPDPGRIVLRLRH